MLLCKLSVKKGANMSTMINEICVGCGKVMGQVSVYDAQFTSDPTCWDCADEALYSLYLNSLADMAD